MKKKYKPFLNMKVKFLLLWISLINAYSYSQTVDTASIVNSRTNLLLSSSLDSSGNVTSVHSYRSDKWRIISRGNVSFKTYHTQIPAIENKIIDLESLECGAIKKRDTLRLMNLWERDFTLDNKANTLLDSKNALPHYLFFARMIETIIVLNNNTV